MITAGVYPKFHTGSGQILQMTLLSSTLVEKKNSASAFIQADIAPTTTNILHKTREGRGVPIILFFNTMVILFHSCIITVAPLIIV